MFSRSGIAAKPLAKRSLLAFLSKTGVAVTLHKLITFFSRQLLLIRSKTIAGQRVYLTAKPATKPRFLRVQPNVVLTLAKINFSGKHKVAESQLRDIGDKFISLEVGHKQLEQLEDAFTGLYRLSGFPFAQIYLSACNWESGVANFNIIEGYIDQVLVNIDNRQLRTAISPIAEQLLVESPVNWQIFQQYHDKLNALTDGEELLLNFYASRLNSGAACAVISDSAHTRP